MSPEQPVPCERITYRAILYENLKDKNGLPKWQNFKRRRADKKGISLAFTEERCTRDLTTEHFGIFTVHVGHVLDVGSTENPITVMQDEPEHSNIIGLPYLFDENEQPIEDFQLKAKAQHLAELLLEHALEHIHKHSLRI